MTLVTAKPVKRSKPVYYNGFDRLLDDFFRFDFPVNTNKTPNRPAVNILEDSKAFALEFMAPGWDKADFQIQVDKNLLTVAAEVKKETDEQGQDATDVQYRRREFSLNSFKRSFEIPENVNVEAIDAKYVNGVLTLTLPKREEEEKDVARTIEIA